MWLARQLQHPGCRDHLFPSFRRLLPTSLRLFSPSPGHQDAPPPAEPAHFMVDYLVSLCGLSSAEALRASKPLFHLKSPEKPDAVLRLLRQEGLPDAHIKRAILRDPRVLLADAKKRVEPQIRALRGAGFSGSQIGELISSNPGVFYIRDLLHHMEFWRQLVGTNENLLKTMRTDIRFLSHNINNRVVPRLALLRSLGVPDEKMGMLVLTRPRLMSAKSDWIEALVEQVKSLGFSPGSRMFVQALLSIANLSRSTFDDKCKLLRSFGWTQDELTSAIQSFPNILRYSETKIQAVMGFLPKEAGCDPSHIARYPRLVGLSMEKRLVPRCCVLRSLKKVGLPLGSKAFISAMLVTEDYFVKKYIVPYNEKLPELLKSYHAVCAKKATSKVDGL